jgi:predicted patatin/cPLA2 family phospholipase
MLTLVLEGGGMRAGFVAGALMALMDKRLTAFDRALAVSASVPTLAYFAAGQRKDLESIWRYELSTARIICYRCIASASLALSVKRPVLDIDYLVDKVFKNRHPLHLQKLRKSRIACVFAVTKVDSETLDLLGPFDHDIYEIFKACLALPGVYPGTVRIGNLEYVDGGTTNPLPVKALDITPPNRVLAILSKPLNVDHEPVSLFERVLFWRYFNKYEWMLERQRESARLYNEQVDMLEELARQQPPRALIVSPDTMPPATLITRDRKKINQAIDLGYEKIEELEDQIRGFLEQKIPEVV